MSKRLKIETVSGKGERRGDDFKIFVRPSSKARAVIVNVPGYKGDISGWNGKYDVIGQYLADKAVGAFIQMPNRIPSTGSYARSLREDIKAVCRYALQKGATLTGSAQPDIYLMGFSAGAGGVAAVASDFPAVKKILLGAPSMDAGEGAISESLRKFTGEVYIVVGERDEVVGHSDIPFRRMAKNACKVESFVIPDCDHQFRGTVNGQILSKAPLWAFAGDTTFPLPDGGLVLY